ncbi:MAG: alanine racemase [Holosporales bacterium]|jgi:alanine racemase|nr:alanine racemase [Holosporales bacterium]
MASDAMLSPGLALLPPYALSAIEIDLWIVQDNYHILQKFLKDSGSSQTICGSVVKANAYGAGVLSVGKTLVAAGCHDFFVADIDEALHLRAVVPEGRIFVFSGVLPESTALFSEQGFIPILLHREQILDWHKEAQHLGQKLPAVLHIDTGMSRTGLMGKDIDWLLENRELLAAFSLQYLLSHLSCSSDRSAPFNDIQRKRFLSFRQYFPTVPASFAASEGITLGKAYHFDSVRPGKFLLGLGEPIIPGLRPAIRVYGRVLEVADVALGQSVGYEGSYTFKHPGRVAVLGIGYADGIPRATGNRGVVKIKGQSALITGYVSMDYTSVDITEVKEEVRPGDWAILVDENLSMENMAQYVGTISRETCCTLGARPYRLYRCGETYTVHPPFSKSL